MIEVLLAAIALGVASFTLLLLAFQSVSQSKSPLIMLLACLLLISTGPIIFFILPSLIQLYVSFLPLLFFILIPSLWFYHESLVTEGNWKWQVKMWRHFALLPIVFLLGCTVFLLPDSAFEQMFFSDDEYPTSKITLLSMTFLVAIVTWCLLSGVYVIKIVKRSIAYRARLNDIYSNKRGKSLTWLSIVSWLLLLAWFYALIVLFFEDKLLFIGISEIGILLILNVIIWIISANGLFQRPGFENQDLQTIDSTEKYDKNTYQRSALTSSDLSRIASKLNSAIASDSMHLDPELTLKKLSAKVGEPSQYVSQTLSQQIGSTFFDFINQARIEDAKKMLLQNNQSVLQIALETGFNSRSSFYKAFKQFTNVTPRQFRTSQSPE